MTRKECFLNAVKGLPVDWVPTTDFLSSPRLIQHFTGQMPRDFTIEDLMAVTKGLNWDATFVPIGGWFGTCAPETNSFKKVTLKEGQQMDEWGVVYQYNESSWPGGAPVFHPLADREDYETYFSVPDAGEPWRLEGIQKAIRLNEGYDCALIGIMNGPFTLALMEMGYENMCYAVFEDPELISDLMERCNTFVITAARKMLEAGADGILLAEDLAHAHGPFFRPEYMRQYIFPHIKAAVTAVHEAGGCCILHSCGNITEILEDVIDTGVDALNPLQVSAGMDLKQVKETCGDRITLIGNLDSTNLLPYGTPEEIRAEVRRILAIGAPGGRFVFCSDSDLRDDMPVENIVAMYEEAKQA